MWHKQFHCHDMNGMGFFDGTLYPYKFMNNKETVDIDMFFSAMVHC